MMLSEKGDFSQFNIMCTYLWHNKRDEYKWYVHDTDPDYVGPGSTLNQLISLYYQYLLHAILAINLNSRNQLGSMIKHQFTPGMYLLKPRIAIHTRYHTDYIYKEYIVEGYCTLISLCIMIPLSIL